MFMQAAPVEVQHSCPPKFHTKSHNFLDKKTLACYTKLGFEGGANALPKSFSAVICHQDDSRKCHPEGLSRQVVLFAKDAHTAGECLEQ